MKNAITFGRYNTTTIAHMHTIERIASEFNNVVVGLIDSDAATRGSDLPKEFVDFYDLADAQHQKNTFSLKERQRLLELSIADSRLDGVVQVAPIPRPEYAVETFNDLFPSSSYQVVFPRPKDGQNVGFDQLRDTALPQILGRSILHLSVDLTLHTSDIKMLAASQPDMWGAVMTPNAYEYFREIGGPERINM